MPTASGESGQPGNSPQERDTLEPPAAAIDFCFFLWRREVLDLESLSHQNIDQNTESDPSIRNHLQDPNLDNGERQLFKLDEDDDVPPLLPPPSPKIDDSFRGIRNRSVPGVALTIVQGESLAQPVPIIVPSCPNSCVAYMGLFSNHIFCPICQEPRPTEKDIKYDSDGNLCFTTGTPPQRVAFESPGWGETFPMCAR